MNWFCELLEYFLVGLECLFVTFLGIIAVLIVMFMLFFNKIKEDGSWDQYDSI